MRTPTAFGDPASSRVLLVADPHPENIGSFRAPDGTVFMDWNDFDSSGYGPFAGATHLDSDRDVARGARPAA